MDRKAINGYAINLKELNKTRNGELRGTLIKDSIVCRMSNLKIKDCFSKQARRDYQM